MTARPGLAAVALAGALAGAGAFAVGRALPRSAVVRVDPEPLPAEPEPRRAAVGGVGAVASCCEPRR